MVEFTYPTSQAAWIGLNRALIKTRPDKYPNQVIYSNQVIIYDVLINIKQSYIDPEWDFTATANYTGAKWTSLVNNYVDKNHLEEVVSVVQHRELKKDKNYNIAFHFSTQHGGGKGCLLTATFSRRYGEEVPSIHATFRASEFYKRGMFDLLLLHRLGQAAWGEDAAFAVDIWAHQLWGGSDWLSLLTSVIPAEKLFRHTKPGTFQAKVQENYNRFKELKDIDGLSYHAHKRAAHVIQGSVKDKRVLVKHCTL
jgi:hypothetical protein